MTKTPLEITVVLIANSFLNFLLALAHALDGNSLVTPGMPYAWSGFFRTELGAQVAVLDYLIVAAWDRLIKQIDKAQSGTMVSASKLKKSDQGIWCTATILSLYGWFVDALYADLGTPINLLLVLPTLLAIVQMVVAVILWRKSSALLRSLDQLIQVAHAIEQPDHFALRQQFFFKRIARAGRLSAFFSVLAVLVLSAGALFMYSSPLMMFLIKFCLLVARLGNSFAQILFCQKNEGRVKHQRSLSAVRPERNSVDSHEVTSVAFIKGRVSTFIPRFIGTK